MKKLSIILASIALSCSVMAEMIEGYSAYVFSPSTNTTATKYTNGPIYGKLLSINAASTGNMNVRYTTLAGKGVSLGNSVLLLNTNALTSAGINTNLANTVYLYGDYIVTEITSAASNGTAYSGIILVAPAP